MKFICKSVIGLCTIAKVKGLRDSVTVDPKALKTSYPAPYNIVPQTSKGTENGTKICSNPDQPINRNY